MLASLLSPIRDPLIRAARLDSGPKLTAIAAFAPKSPDSDDQNPKFLDDKYTLVMDESQQNAVGKNLRLSPRSLRAQDADRAIQAAIVYSFEEPTKPPLEPDADAEPEPEAEVDSAGANRPSAQPSAHNIETFLHLSKSSGEIRLLRQWPANWLRGPLTLVVRATQADNRDRYALTTLTIAPASRAGSWPAAGRAHGQPPDSAGAKRTGVEFAAKRVHLSVPESAPLNEKIGAVRAQLTGEPGAPSDSVDLIGSSSARPDSTWLSALGGQPRKLGARSPPPKAEAAKRPARELISYQILDDQTDQFGVNQNGDIMLKRALDYELRQSFAFRVLASYSRYSDLCQVQVDVTNVNDNKPKVSCNQRWRV